MVEQYNLTLEQLALFNGRNGYPAFVAANGVIYDVTYNAAWAAGTHFGLEAGTDVTRQLACHIGQPVLNTLRPVGVLVQPNV